MAPTKIKVGIIGARGHTGAELVKLLVDHPGFELALVTSRESAGRPVGEVIAGVDLDLTFTSPTPAEAVGSGVDHWILALPNGQSAPWVEAIEAATPEAVIVDLSTDHRFDKRWVYGLPEIERQRLVGARRIANPGCYATAAELAIYPLIGELDGPAHVFGISGYSGAGTTPSPRNDPARLADNVMPYALSGHAHETEIRWQLGHKVFFTPVVASFFRGLVVTAHMTTKAPLSVDEIVARFEKAYAFEPLVTLQRDIPEPRAAAFRHGATVGGFAAEATERHVVVCATLDNLLKGAATQALQNLNLASGQDELAGIRKHLTP
ncbi:MAG: N-acetyl-gamma-glutamyl-phosphate reductase [Deltaproteobacteria bacterium]|nr:N-acetyl-gamma-glutamyl-phosphate reductase [Deltaproteobacteria bacterium]